MVRRPSARCSLELSRDKNEIVRAKAAELMGLYATDETRERLLDLFEDSDRFVRRKAMEAVVRAEQQAPPDTVIPLLASDDRFEAWAARRLLEVSPADQWRDAVLKSDQQRIFIQGALALLIAEPSPENAFAVLERSSQLHGRFRQRSGLRRHAAASCRWPCYRATSRPSKWILCAHNCAEEFPAGDPLMNRELIRLLVYLQDASIMDRYFEYLNSDVSHPDKMHVAMYLRFLTTGWTIERKEEWFQFVTQAKTWDGGSGYPLYLGNAARDFARPLTAEESVEILHAGPSGQMRPWRTLQAAPPTG